MKATKLLLCFLFAGFAAASQGKKAMEPSYFVFDKEGNPCKIENAYYFGVLQKLSDSAWQWKYYNFSGPMISIETYKDEQMTIPNGYFAFFDEKGMLDSCGLSQNGRKDKTWRYYTDSLTVWQTEEYSNGKLLERKDQKRLDDERKTPEKTTFTRVEVEANFKGGVESWKKYLEKNLKFPDRANSLHKSGTVYILFVVNTDGSIAEISLLKSVEFSIDEESIRLISKAPKWQPAMQDGRTVKAWRKQPLTFQWQ